MMDSPRPPAKDAAPPRSSERPAAAGDVEPTIAADSALRSKHPGAAMGYTLLVGSGDRERAERLIEPATTGVPSGENIGRIDALPWLTFVGDPAGDPAVLGVVSRSWAPSPSATASPRKTASGLFRRLRNRDDHRDPQERLTADPSPRRADP